MIKPNEIVCLVIITIVLVTTSCSMKTIPSAEVNYISDKDGTVTIRTIGYGSNQEDAIEDAEKNAFTVLLFRGLPESEQKNALVGTNESEEIEKNKDYFTKFYNDKRYRTFIMFSVPTSDLIKHKGGKKSIAVDIKINLIALRKDLEQNNVIRRFGY
mgnify:FL=1